MGTGRVKPVFTVNKKDQINGDVPGVARVLERAVTQKGVSFVELSNGSPLLVVFLRHAGCSFCREALSDISRSRPVIESEGSKILLVHMGDDAAMGVFLQKHHLEDIDRIVDPDQELYRAFGLKSGTAWQLFGSKVLWRAFLSGVLVKHGLGRVAADASQMPGVFYLEKGAVVRRFRHGSAADRPDYVELSSRP